jgi:kumamolisin
MSDRKIFQNSVTPLPPQEGLTPSGLMVNAATPEHRDTEMTLLFSLEIPPEAQAELEAKVARGEVVPPDEIQKNYSADPADLEVLTSWLKEQGFEIKQVSGDRTSVYAQASVDQIQQSLGVNMVSVTKDGLTYPAAQNAPSLPAEVGKSVHAIIGLQPFRQAHKHSRKCLPRHGNRMSLATSEDATPDPSPNIQNAPPYLVNEVLRAYNADGLSVTGKGQTIAILIDTFPADADLQAFWQQNGVATGLQRVEKINVKGGPLPPPEGEETLDVSWASGIAPGARIRIYATGSLRFVDLDLALDRIIADLPGQPGMRQLSISLGLGETFMAKDEVDVQRSKFAKLALAGVNIFVSSGDAGSNPDVTGHNSAGPLQAEYESSDSSVIGVGGTTLSLSPGGGVAAETGWVSSGGGQSIFFNRPAWQTGPGVPAGDKRLVPDVSLTADPNNGAFLVLHGKVVQYGGTSWSAPVWAGFCALMNEARASAHKPLLPFLNPLIYPLMGTPCFRDIQGGSNGAFEAGPSYDMVTGIGVPNVQELIQALIQ